MKASLEQSVVAQIKQSVVTQIKEIAKKEMSEYLLHLNQETQSEKRPVNIDSGKPESIESEPFINTSHFEKHHQAFDEISSITRQHQDSLNRQNQVFFALPTTSMSKQDLKTPVYHTFTAEDTK